MNHFSAEKYMTPEQAARLGRVSQKIQALRRVVNAEHAPLAPRSGLQLAIVTLDMRTSDHIEHCALLFDIGRANRYRWMLDMQKQQNPVGWHAAARSVINLTRPLCPQ